MTQPTILVHELACYAAVLAGLGIFQLLGTRHLALFVPPPVVPEPSFILQELRQDCRSFPGCMPFLVLQAHVPCQRINTLRVILCTSNSLGTARAYL